MSDVDRGYTLVQILIVIIIMCILAMLVIPQMTDASDEARDSAVKTDLRAIRPQVRIEAARAVGEMGQKAGGASPCLVGLLDDEDRALRAEARQALVRIGQRAVRTCRRFHRIRTMTIRR